MRVKTFLATFYIAYAAHANPFDQLNRDRPICFTHTYSKIELEHRPKQTVKKLALKFYVDANGSANDPLLELHADIKRPEGVGHYHEQMLCTLKSDEMQCSVECDGGSATIAWPATMTANGRILFKNEGFVLYGGCGDDDQNTIWLSPTAGGDDRFDLESTSC